MLQMPKGAPVEDVVEWWNRLASLLLRVDQAS
jgi:hypothetical protein